MLELKGILLDLDGTLIDSISLIEQSDKMAIEKFGFKVSHQKLRELSQLHSRDIACYLMDEHKISIDLHDFVKFRRHVFVQLLKRKKKLWFSDAKSFLLEMALKSFKIGIVTGSRKAFLKHVFDKKTLKQIDCIITSDDVEHKKPDIESLEKALQKLKLKKNEIAFIGDSTFDGLMCQRFGIKFIAKTTGISTIYQLKKFNPMALAKTFKEIEGILEFKGD